MIDASSLKSSDAIAQSRDALVKPFRVLDLFSGIGGFSLGLERTNGFKTVAFCEIEPYCRRVLAKHWPKVPCYDDVRTLTAARLAADGIAVDVIAGGFPCQDISEAGLRTGLQGARSGLWREYARLVGEIRPRFVIVENVSELLRNGLGDVLGDLAEVGYDAEWHSLPALAVGADHIRERIWIIAYPDCAGVEVDEQRGRKQRQAQMGKDAAPDHAHTNSARLPRRLSAGALREDARAIGPWLGLALSSAPAFPGVDGAGAPVLGRGEDGDTQSDGPSARHRKRRCPANSRNDRSRHLGGCEMPVCIGCKEDRPETDFRFRKDLNWLNSRCRPCERIVQIDNYYKRKKNDPFGWKVMVLRNCRSREISEDWVLARLSEQNHRCAISGQPIDRLDFEVDHIVPRSKGGGNELANLQLVCRAANSAKSDLTNDELVTLCAAIIQTLRPELIGKAILEAEGLA